MSVERFPSAPRSNGIAQAVTAFWMNRCGAGEATMGARCAMASIFLPLWVLYFATSAAQWRGINWLCKRAKTQQSASVRVMPSCPPERISVARSRPSWWPGRYSFCQACFEVLSMVSAARAETIAESTPL
ncbi:hypothetical protein D9M69_495210 [compost metagenome]